MKVHALFAFLCLLRIKISRCQSEDSTFSCALGRASVSYRESNMVTKIYNIINPDGASKADGYVFFYLYTRDNPSEQQLVLGDSTKLLASNFNTSRPTKIITHGYMNSRVSPSCALPKDAFLNNGDYNVIVVDWWAMQSIWGTIPLNYWTVSGYVGEVGSYVAAMINFLENHGMKVETTTLIGHSLGAHVMGIAGYQAKSKVNYIVGLDPALPAFESRSNEERLSIEDASTVEVIHTNEGNCGMSQQIGHYDFYPNGGGKQPGCKTNRCSHSRVYELYAESIYSKNGFFGRRCLHFDAVKKGECFGDVVMMGGNTLTMKSEQPGMYHVKTRETAPYALGIEELTQY